MLINGLIVTLSLYHNNAVVGQDNLVTLVYHVRVALKDRKLWLGGADALCGDGRQVMDDLYAFKHHFSVLHDFLLYCFVAFTVYILTIFQPTRQQTLIFAYTTIAFLYNYIHRTQRVFDGRNTQPK